MAKVCGGQAEILGPVYLRLVYSRVKYRVFS